MAGNEINSGEYSRLQINVFPLKFQSSNPQELEDALDEALKAGYRHIDTAYMYENEHVIGKVLKRWLDSGSIKRDELFVVTKV